MATYVTANKNAKTEFKIPVEWSVYDCVYVQANSLKEAYDYVENNLDEIPLGDEAEYVEESYEIAADDMDGCVGYQPINDLVCTEFDYDYNLSKYVDSMLFDSGTSIATGKFYYRDRELTIELAVCGAVSVSYGDDVFLKPSEFPDELINLIKEHPYNWELEDFSINVGLNNWFEYVLKGVGDGELFEGDLSKTTAEDILEDMKAVARLYYEDTPIMER